MQERQNSPEGGSFSRYSAPAREEGARRKRRFRVLVGIEILLFAAGVFALWRFSGGSVEGIGILARGVDYQKETELAVEAALREAKEHPWQSETEAPPVPFQPYHTEGTDPGRLIEYTQIEENGVLLEEISDFAPWYHMDFPDEGAYTQAQGVITFRGDHYRNSPVYGGQTLQENALEGIWTKATGGLQYNNAVWTGSGWTGQPLIVKWPRSVKQAMNMEDWAKEDDTLVEVIYACMDGYIYFLDLESGRATRPAMYLGYTFKGSGALDPRGYPIMYVGAGYDSYQGTARAFIINLLDCSVLYTFGNNDPFSLRGNLSYFDSSALVDADSDTLIYPGENGILYLIHLNTSYDEKKGTLSVDPDRVVKWRYYGTRTSTASYWLGMEDSAAICGEYLFIADNGGNLMCLNLNTLELVWVTDVLDDSNSTPVLAKEDGHLYLYVSTSFHLGWRSRTSAPIPIWKIDAQTGEVVWQTEYTCYTEDGVSGGVQSTIALGENNLSEYLYVTVSRTGGAYDGVLSCLNKRTGEVMWEHSAYYAWSSPVCVYNAVGAGRVLYCSCDGNMYLLDGISGEVYDTFPLSKGAIEASPAVYEDYVVVGTRASQIWGLRLK